MIFKMKYQRAGWHYHLSLFAASREGQTFAKCGDLCVRVEEFEPLRSAMGGVFFESISERQDGVMVPRAE